MTPYEEQQRYLYVQDLARQLELSPEKESQMMKLAMASGDNWQWLVKNQAREISGWGPEWSDQNDPNVDKRTQIAEQMRRESEGQRQRRPPKKKGDPLGDVVRDSGGWSYQPLSDGAVEIVGAPEGYDQVIGRVVEPGSESHTAIIKDEDVIKGISVRQANALGVTGGQMYAAGRQPTPRDAEIHGLHGKGEPDRDRLLYSDGRLRISKKLDAINGEEKDKKTDRERGQKRKEQKIAEDNEELKGDKAFYYQDKPYDPDNPSLKEEALRVFQRVRRAREK